MAVTMMSVITWHMAMMICVRSGSGSGAATAGAFTKTKVLVPIGRGSLDSERRRTLGITIVIDG